MKRILIVGFLLLSLSGSAHAAGFRAGIVNPIPVPAADSRALGSQLQRYDLVWRGESTFTGSLIMASDTTPVVSVSTRIYNGAYPSAAAPAFCGWATSILDRYPRVHYVIVGNEPGGSPDDYATTLAFCSRLLHAHGAFVLGPGLHPRYDVQLWLNAIARKGRGVLDAFDFHPYWNSNFAYDRDVIQRVHKTLGQNVQAWVTEDGKPVNSGWWYTTSEVGQAQGILSSMAAARCAGAKVWMNFMYADAPWGWTSGLVRKDSSRKPAFSAFASAARSDWCPGEPVQKPPPHTYVMKNDPNYRGYM